MQDTTLNKFVLTKQKLLKSSEGQQETSRLWLKTELTIVKQSNHKTSSTNQKAGGSEKGQVSRTHMSIRRTTKILSSTVSITVSTKLGNGSTQRTPLINGWKHRLLTCVRIKFTSITTVGAKDGTSGLKKTQSDLLFSDRTLCKTQSQTTFLLFLILCQNLTKESSSNTWSTASLQPWKRS